MRDFRSNISCLSVEGALKSERSPERDLSPLKLIQNDSTKYNRNLLTSVETGTFLKTTANRDIVCTTNELR